jgi:hypothetical protein
MAGYVHVIGFIAKVKYNRSSQILDFTYRSQDSAATNVAKSTIRKGITLRGIQIGTVEQ